MLKVYHLGFRQPKASGERTVTRIGFKRLRQVAGRCEEVKHYRFNGVLCLSMPETKEDSLLSCSR
nr:hypothetical protein [Candidatus Bathyarchaeota archaeon]